MVSIAGPVSQIFIFIRSFTRLLNSRIIFLAFLILGSSCLFVIISCTFGGEFVVAKQLNFTRNAPFYYYSSLVPS